jgi:hypothetical protein
MTDLVGGAQKTNRHARPLQELISEEPFHMVSLFIFISNSHPIRRVVRSINIPYVYQKLIFHFDEIGNLYGLFAIELLSVLTLLVLVSSS